MDTPAIAASSSLVATVHSVVEFTEITNTTTGVPLVGISWRTSLAATPGPMVEKSPVMVSVASVLVVGVRVTSVDVDAWGTQVDIMPASKKSDWN
jgi:hypothetical protein